MDTSGSPNVSRSSSPGARVARLAASLIGTALLLSNGCGDASDGDLDVSELPAISPAEAVVEAGLKYVESRCRTAFLHCSRELATYGTRTGEYYEVSSQGSFETCRDQFRERGPFDAAAVAAVEAGMLGFDATAVEACIGGYEERFCHRTTGPRGRTWLPAACDDLFTPLSELGEACVEGSCAEPLSHCETGDQQCGGVCVSSEPSLGDSCSADRDCPTPLICVSGQCTKRSELGEACTSSYYHSEGARCAVGLYCQEEECVETGGTEGQWCSSWMGCAEGLTCNTEVRGAFPSVVISWACRVEHSAGRGEACGSEFLCPENMACQSPTGTAGPGEIVFQTGICTDLSLAPAGAACDLPGEDPAKGAASCEPGLVCRSSKCEAPAEQGQACRYQWDCAAGLVCSNGTCSRLQDDGEACTFTFECETGSCVKEPDAMTGQCQTCDLLEESSE